MWIDLVHFPHWRQWNPRHFNRDWDPKRSSRPWSTHGYMFQSVEPPNGLCMDLWGPDSFRRSDIDLLTDSNINGRLAAVMADIEKQYRVYGDGIFPHLSHITSKHTGDTTIEERYENGIMTKIRIANEWAYGITENLFTMIKFHYSFRLRKNSECPYFYIAATILRNAHCCLYGNKVSQYFSCLPPTLENYFSAN